MSANYKDFFSDDSDESPDDDKKSENFIGRHDYRDTTPLTVKEADDIRRLEEQVNSIQNVLPSLQLDPCHNVREDVHAASNQNLKEEEKTIHVCPSITFDKYKLLDHMIKNKCPLLKRLPARIIKTSNINKTVELEIVLNSKESSSNDFMNNFYELIKDWETAVIKLSEDQIDFLGFQSGYLETFGVNRLGIDDFKLDIYGVIYRQDAKYCLTVTCNSGIPLAKKKLEKEIFSHVKKLSREEEKILVTETWKEFQKRSKEPSLYVRTKQGSDSHSTRIIVTGKSDFVSAYKSKLEEFFKKNVRVTKKINSCQGFVKLLQLFCINKLMRDVDLKFANTFIEISGLEEFVTKKEHEILEMITNISQNSFEVEETCLKAELFTKEKNDAKSLIDDVMKKNDCYIHVTERITQKDAKTSFSLLSPSSWIASWVGGNDKLVRNNGKKETNITLIEGSIVDFKNAEILVNSFCSKIYKGDFSRCGAITKAFLKSGGRQFQQELLNADIPHIFGSEPKVTRACGSLKAKYVFNSRISNNRNGHSLELMKKTILANLIKAVELRCRSIAFPTMGCGHLNYSIKEISNCFFEAEQEFHNSKDLKIYICCYDKNSISEFEDCLSRSGKTLNNFRKIPSESSKYASPPKRGFDWDTQGVQRAVIFTMFSLDKNSFLAVEQSIKSGVKCLCEEVKLKHEMLSYLHSLSPDSSKKLSALPLANFSRRIDGQSSKTELVLSGLKSEIYRIKDQISQILDEEKENRKNPEYVKKNFGKKAYLELCAKSEDFTLPHFWRHYKYIEIGKDQAVKISLLDYKGDVYKAIHKLVQKTWDRTKVGQGRDGINLRHSNIEVKQIYIVENPLLFKMYVYTQKNLSHKAAIKPSLQLEKPSGKIETTGVSDITDKHLVSEINECYLFHGTKATLIENITSNGIDFRLCSDNAMFGKGAYFSESSTKADQYADDKDYRCQNGTVLTMFLSRVLLGDSYMCTKPNKFKRPPCIESSCMNNVTCQEGSHRTADSVVGTHRDDGSLLNFREFIVYESRSSYPEFMIKYIRK